MCALQEGNQTDTVHHAVNPGGCFDYADDDPLFKSIHGGAGLATAAAGHTCCRPLCPLRIGAPITH